MPFYSPPANFLLGGVLSRLARDTRGNVLVLMAAMLIPLAAFSGSAIDMARLYTVKTRLQQACDAGALAGAKYYSGGAALDANATSNANLFFNSNFKTGWFNTRLSGQPLFTPSVTVDHHVQGAASVNVPMTIMAMFGQATRTLNVTCEAEFDGDNDIMFVLDVTGSMACLPSDTQNACEGNYLTTGYNGTNYGANVNSDANGYWVTEKNNSRMAAVRSAVLSFYDTVTSKADPSVAFRFGFVPFSVSVNAGNAVYAVNPSYIANNWNYQSRVSAGGSNWTYQQRINIDTSAYKTGQQVSNPAQTDGSKSTWAGCLEERDTTPGVNSFDPANPPLDLDVDKAPSASLGAGSYWRAAWPDIIFTRNSSPETTSASRTINWRQVGYGDTYNTNAGVVLEDIGCPRKVSRLSENKLPSNSSASAISSLRQQMSSYMSSSNLFRPFGRTYLDAGMTWGTRLLSPQGIFGADTAPWPGHAGVNRYLIFLTDGAMETDCAAYSSHGIEQYDQRVIGGSCSNSTLDSYHYSRFSAACTIAKNHNITVFVILFGQSQQTLPAQFTSCASPGQAYYADNKAALTQAFNAIAAQVALLRLSQ